MRMRRISVCLRALSQSSWMSIVSVAEMANAGQYHCPASRISRGQDLRIANRPAGLDHGAHPRLGQQLDAVRKWKEAVRCRHRAFRALAGALQGQTNRPDTARRPLADADPRVIAHKDDAVGR